MRAGYGENLRSFLSEYNPVLLVDFADKKVFEAASVDVNILLLTKEDNMHSTHACVAREKSGNDLSVYVKQNGCDCSFDINNGWLIMTPIELSIKKKIEKYGTPLKGWDVSINYGVKTGYNSAFIIPGAIREELIREDPKSAEIIRPILRGKDIKRYGYVFNDQWLINVHNGIKEKGVYPIDINKYPAIKTYLNRYYKHLVERQDQGITPYNLRNCAYMDDFTKQKIIWGEISDKPKFSIDLDGDYVVEATVFMMVGSHLKYLLCFLNSSLSAYYFSKYGTTIGEALRWKKYMVEKLPIPKVTAEDEEIIVKLIDSLLSANSKEESDNYSKLIDKKIYSLFGFDDAEISFIEAIAKSDKYQT